MLIPFAVPLLLGFHLVQTPHEAIERAWGPLTRSTHERGSWVARVGDKLIGGDWKVTSAHKSFNPLAHQASQLTWVHYIDTLGAGYCAVALEDPKTMYCQLSRCDDLSKCSAKQAPLAIHEKVETIEPTLAQELMLFRRIHKRDLGQHLGVAFDRKATTTFTIKLPYRIEVTGSKKHWSNVHGSGFDRRLAGYEAEIRFGPRARDVTIVRERATEVVTETCSYPAYAAMSCMPPPPACEIR